ncbi:MAG: nucleotidyl transferase AbiEii/AbiGii toxin family protein [candidate division WWE3 bacterium]|nr:nucleotidyl transferase AbiEii/AbiGii toxin family protein [candidate division WWE3 bacterium]
MMPISKPADAIHKVWLYRVLTEILDNTLLSQHLYFKGGTCASMIGYLDRFSVDLDFDLKDGTAKAELRTQIYKVVKTLGLSIKDESKNALQFFLKYEAPTDSRNTLKLDINDLVPQTNDYIAKSLMEINRTANCQTIETMFANKLVASLERFEKTRSVAGRDIYDIHHFFMSGYKYKPEIIKERRGTSVIDFIKNLLSFIEIEITETVIDQDLNLLLPPLKYRQLRKTLKSEVLVFLKDELTRLQP